MYSRPAINRLVLLALAFGPLGCGKAESDRKPTFAVEGRVLEGTKPIANATVVFHPIGDAGVKPRGKTDAKGIFKLTTYDGDDGAPDGACRVTVELWATVHVDAGPVNRISAKFAKPESSGLAADVAAGPNVLQPFNLKK